MTVAVAAAIAMATLAAATLAIAAILQNVAVSGALAADRAMRAPLVNRAGFTALVRNPRWLAGAVLGSAGSVLHAVALVFAPLAIVQPLGVLAVPFTIAIGAWRTRIRPSAGLLITVATCVAAVAAFVTLAEVHLGAGTPPHLLGMIIAAGTACVLAAVLAALGAFGTGWWRCLAFATSGATAFGLASALIRLISLHLTTGANDLGGLLVPALGIVAAILVGSWAVQQAHASGAPSVVVGCLTVLDPLVAVVLGITLLGEGGSTTPGAVAGLIGCAVIGLGAVLVLARHHTEFGHRRERETGTAFNASDKPRVAAPDPAGVARDGSPPTDGAR